MTKFFIVFLKVTVKSDFFDTFSKCEKSTVRADKNTHCDFQKHINIFIEI